MSTFPHATPHGYNLGCRRRCCRDANTDRMRERREYLRTLRQLVDGRLVSPYAPHGTTNGYGNWQCRCAPCCEAHSINLKRQRANRLARRRERTSQ